MEESIKQLALVSSVLGGFSFTFLSAILAFGTEKKIKFWLIIGLMIASMCFLLSALGWSMIDLNRDAAGIQSHHQSLVKLLLLGLVAIIASLGLSGWLSNKKTGIATSAISLLALLFLIFGILSRYIIW
ncbi:MAG: hypothetical protein KIT80_19195 [Chitinophagaceae bacterium]|nr:hypothetical protein [Chitinophagaceae bacterium]MCW5929054.1 hypothetical protein [Chitinophagaceae bacterium]